MHFILEAKYEVIRETVPHKLYRPLVNPSNKFWRELAQTETPTSTFNIGNYLKQKNKGKNGMAEMADIKTNDTGSIMYSIMFFERKHNDSN